MFETKSILALRTREDAGRRPNSKNERPFAAFARIEPELARLRQRIRTVHDDGGTAFCANELWYEPGGFKERLLRLAGWSARNPELRTAEAYDSAYEELYDQLPPCRACACIAFDREARYTYAYWRKAQAGKNEERS